MKDNIMKVSLNWQGMYVDNGCNEVFDIKPVKAEMERTPVEVISYINAMKDILGEDVVKTVIKGLVANNL